MVFGGDYPGRVFVAGHEKIVLGAPFKGIKRVQGAPPGTKNQGGHVQNGLQWPPEREICKKEAFAVFLALSTDLSHTWFEGGKAQGKEASFIMENVRHMVTDSDISTAHALDKFRS